MPSVPMYYMKAVPPAKPLPATTTLRGYIHHLLFKLIGYNKLGLYHNDVLYNFPDVLEAVRRLPPEIQDARNYRLIRAVQLDITRSILPENQWTTYEDDLKYGRYLEPYLEEVKKELREQDEWNATH
ncbi:hypothetical protein PGB90_001573 [Kerria lacca]